MREALVALLLTLEGVIDSMIDKDLISPSNAEQCVYCESTRRAQIGIPCEVGIWYAGMIDSRCFWEYSVLHCSLPVQHHLEIICVEVALRSS